MPKGTKATMPLDIDMAFRDYYTSLYNLHPERSGTPAEAHLHKIKTYLRDSGLASLWAQENFWKNLLIHGNS